MAGLFATALLSGIGGEAVGRGEPIHLLAAVFGRRERNLLGMRCEPD